MRQHKMRLYLLCGALFLICGLVLYMMYLSNRTTENLMLKPPTTYCTSKDVIEQHINKNEDSITNIYAKNK